jgi:hypothetical protein
MALVGTVVVVAHRAPASALTTTVIDVRESIGRYDQDLDLQVSVGAQTSFVRQRSPARWVQAEALASAIDGRLQSDPAMAHADELAGISSAARACQRRRAVAASTVRRPRSTVRRERASGRPALRAALDAYPVRWLDRLAFEPLLWLVLLAGLAVSALTLAHAGRWMFGATHTWAQREQQRVHEELFWKTLVTDGCVVGLLLLVLATHSLNNGAAVAALSVLAAAALATAVIAEQRSHEIIDVLKSHDREPEHAAVPARTTPGWRPTQTTVRTHVLSTMPPLVTASLDGDVLLLSDGLRAEVDEPGTLLVVAEPIPRQ